jgi:NAD(P)-dependent dehydrogenase (short-subunit alcohol dehydrogenase family)
VAVLGGLDFVVNNAGIAGPVMPGRDAAASASLSSAMARPMPAASAVMMMRLDAQ